MVCNHLDKALDVIWRKLESQIHDENPGISQYSLDALCVAELSKLVENRSIPVNQLGQPLARPKASIRFDDDHDDHIKFANGRPVGR